MIRIAFYVLLFLTIFSCHSGGIIEVNSCLPAGLQDGLLAFYPFSKGTLKDHATGHFDLVNGTHASPATDREGNLDCAYWFDNVTNSPAYLHYAEPLFLNNLNAFSISLWYMPVAQEIHNYQILVSRGDLQHCPDRRGEWSLGLYDCSCAVFGHNNSVWANLYNDSCDGNISGLASQWQHLVSVYNQGIMKLYLNGILQDTVSGLADCTTVYLAQDKGDLFIGKGFTGKIDDILIYDRELTEIEVIELFWLGGCCEL